MRYDDSDRESSNVEDRRGEARGRFPFPGGGRGVPIQIGGRGGLSFTTLLIIGALMLMFGVNPLDLLQGGPRDGSFPDLGREIQLPRNEPTSPFPQRQGVELPRRGDRAGPAQDETVRFVRRVLADTEDVWKAVFARNGLRYEEPRLVLFEDSVGTQCGEGVAQVGPFYCPLDRKVYLDLSFFAQLARQFKAPGDFAQAYVVAHEVGHHVQTLLGIAGKVQEAKRRMSERQANQLQVRMELQADCLAGMWARLTDQANNRLEPGDIEEGLNAASRIGDDVLQRQMTGRVVPDAFTHGSAEQRVRWFRRGFETGSMQACDTFSASAL